MTAPTIAGRDFPDKLNLGSGLDFREDFLNLDYEPEWGPDIVADLNRPFPPADGQPFHTARFGPIFLQPGTFRLILAHDLLEHLANLTTAMTSCLNLLAEGGEMDIVVPYDLSFGAWQDPTHVRAFNEKSWWYFSEWFWRLGWTTHRFNISRLGFGFSDLGKQMRRDGQDDRTVVRTPRAVDHMRVLLAKVALTPEERKKAASLRPGPRAGAGGAF